MSTIAPDRDFFIIGCQRSGTTLLKLILECHRAVRCFDEHFGYQILANPSLRPPPTNGKQYTGFKTPRLTEQFLQKTFRDHDLSDFPNHYSAPHLLFIVRDVRDTIVSMFALRTGNGCWFERWGLPAITQKLKTDCTFSARYQAIWNFACASEEPLLAAAAVYWRYKSESLLEYRNDDIPIHLVRYEDLVGAPEIELRLICNWLGVAWDSSLLTHGNHPHEGIFANGLTIGNTDPTLAIHDSSVRSWRKYFSRRQEQIVMQLAGPLHDELYPR